MVMQKLKTKTSYFSVHFFCQNEFLLLSLLTKFSMGSFIEEVEREAKVWFGSMKQKLYINSVWVAIKLTQTEDG